MNITPEIVRELLHYDPDTGVFTHRERGEHWFKSSSHCKAWNTRFAGKRAGGIRSNSVSGYRRHDIGLLGRDRLAHHLAWLYMTDEPLPDEIDHINRDATDNRWCNLRPAIHIDNGRNLSMKRNNTSGVTGVSWCNRRGKWRAYGKKDGRQHWLGYHDDIDLAAKAVKAFHSLNGFDPEHGLEKTRYRRRVAC